MWLGCGDAQGWWLVGSIAGGGGGAHLRAYLVRGREALEQHGLAPHAAHLVVLEGLQVAQLPRGCPHPEHRPGEDSPRGMTVRAFGW